MRKGIAQPASSGPGPVLAVWGMLFAAVSFLAAAPAALSATYSPTRLGLSEAAAQGVEGAWVARAGFLLFGLAVLLLAQLSSETEPPAIWVPYAAFGVSMIGVAVFAHAPWDPDAPFVAFEDTLHSVFASAVGISFILGVVSKMVVLRRRPWRAAVPDLGAVVVALVVPMTMSTPLWGVFQRVMFLTAAVWFGGQARASRSSPIASSPGRADRPGEPGPSDGAELAQ